MNALPHWPTHATGLQKALDHAGNTHSLDDVLEQIQQDPDTYWLAAQDHAWVFEILRYPRKTVGRIWLATGALPSLKERLPHVLEWFRQQGCQAVLVDGRLGWKRAKLDYTRAIPFLRLEFGD